MTYPIPFDEVERLSAVRALGILDSARQREFDALAELAVRLLDVPICLISIMDADRQWFKSALGMDVDETPRAIAFCNHTICRRELFEVQDAPADPRFADNPLVTGNPFAKAYAGVPLVIDSGRIVGSLCVLDTNARSFSAEEKRILDMLGGLASQMVARFEDAEKLRLINRELELHQHHSNRQARELALHKSMLDCASSLARIGAWERDLTTNDYKWSEGMYALHEVDRPFEPTPDSIYEFYDPPERARLEAVVAEAVRNDQPYCFEGEMITAKGNRRHIRIMANVEFVDGVAVRRYGMKQDITEEKEAMREITRLAERDGLTNLHNRSFLQKTLKNAGKHAGGGLTLLLMDLDGFKDINDTHGHAAGDQCLTEIADRLRKVASQDMVVTRAGGDEFAIVIHGRFDPEATARLASRINEVVLFPLDWNGHGFELSTSIGIAWREPGEEVEANELLLEADLALYAAKQGGRNRAAQFHVEMKRSVAARYRSLRDMRSALSEDQLELYYQPKVQLGDERHLGFEALLRWNSPDGTVKAPNAFAYALNDPKLCIEIGDYVLGEALAQARRWKQAGFDFGSIAVNLSAGQFRDARLARHILDRIEAAGLSPDMVEMEVTEGVFLSRADNALQICRELQQNGVRIAFDDFGTGFASLTHLTEFPVDVIKIDKAFVFQLGSNPKTAAIVTAMAGLASTINLEMVAEGVETREQADLLQAVGCERAQGYLFARPLPASKASRWLVEKMRVRSRCLTG